MASMRMPERGCGDSVGVHVEIDPVAIRKGSELNPGSGTGSGSGSGPGREKLIHSSKMKLMHQLNPEMAAAVMAADRTRVFAENNKRIYQTFKNHRQPRLSPYISNHASRLRRTINSRLRRPIINSASTTDKPCLRLRVPAHPLSCTELLNPSSDYGDLDYDPSYNNNSKITSANLPPRNFPTNIRHQRHRLNNRNFGLGFPFNYDTCNNFNSEYDTDLGNTPKGKGNHYLKRDYNSDPSFKMHQTTTTMKMNLPPLKIKDGTYARNTINASNSSSGEPCRSRHFNKNPNNASNNGNGTTATSKSPKFPNSNSYYKLQPALVRNLKKLDFQDAHFSLPSISKDGKNYCYDYDANYDPWDSAGSGSDTYCFKKGNQIERLNLNSYSQQNERSSRGRGKQVVDGGIRTVRRNYVRNYSDRNSGIGATALSTIVPRKNIFLQPLPPTTPPKTNTNCCNGNGNGNGESSRNRKNQHHFHHCPTSPSSSQSRSANNSHDNLNWNNNKNIRACESKSASVIVKRNLHESIPHLLSPSLRARARAHPEDEPHPRYRSTVGQDDYDLQYVKNRLANLSKLKLPPISTPANPNSNRNLAHGVYDNECYLQRKNKCARGFPSQERVPVCDAFLLRKLFELEVRERDRLQREQREFSARVINAGNSNLANESNNSDVDVEDYDYELCNNENTNTDSGIARSQLLRSSYASGGCGYGPSKSYCDGDGHGDDRDPARKPSTYFNGPVRYVDRGQKDFILENAINSTRMPPKIPRPRVIDDCYGHSRVISQTRMTSNKDYGRIPEYLIRRKEELRLEKEEEELLWDEEESACEQEQCRVLSDVERKSLTDRLSYRWEQLFEEFQSFPMFSSSQRVIRRKSKIEDELRELEENLRLLSRHGKLFVSNSNSDPTTTPLLPPSYIQKTQFLWK